MTCGSKRSPVSCALKPDKFALLPGIYFGEMGVDGAFAFIPKKKLRQRMAEIEGLARP